MMRQLATVVIGLFAFVVLSLALALEMVGLIEPEEGHPAYRRRTQ